MVVSFGYPKIDVLKAKSIFNELNIQCIYNICNDNTTTNNNNNNIQYILWVFSSTNGWRFQNVKDQQLPPKTNKKEPEFFHPP